MALQELAAAPTSGAVRAVALPPALSAAPVAAPDLLGDLLDFGDDDDLDEVPTSGGPNNGSILDLLGEPTHCQRAADCNDADKKFLWACWEHFSTVKSR